MKPKGESDHLLKVTRSKAKMYEYSVPEAHHINLYKDPAKLFTISIGLLGDCSAAISRGETENESISLLKKELIFSARFFDSYLQTKLNKSRSDYLLLIGSASYYLCDFPGSASVLVKNISRNSLDLGGGGLEYLLHWMLHPDLAIDFNVSKGPYSNLITEISHKLIHYFQSGTDENKLIELANELRKKTYESGTPRELLFGDVIVAVLKNKIRNSTWKALPKYSELPTEKWRSALQKKSFISEFWPAQHLLGEEGVLKGESAVVLMPTSAGKTKATELIIRSAFLANRISLAVIIAPFRALCHEIKNSLVNSFQNENIKVNELSDALQFDFDFASELGDRQILVVTPEKLLYVLRHAPELADQVGMLIFDEGHQFDNDTRGITYELLLTSLRSMVSEEVQKVLISAVISNAESVSEWLNTDPKVVKGTSLIPTFRSVGFASWRFTLGRVNYVDGNNIGQHEFFVPRVIEQIELNKRGKERIKQFFPVKNGNDISLYLGLKLCNQGAIAIFCGRKQTVESISKKAVKIFKRGIPLQSPEKFSCSKEVERLHFLLVKNLGEDALGSLCAKYGIFTHYGNAPHGIRLSVEHAMRKSLVKFVVCTSTLAQGVNLPIRYLIVTSFYQGLERIKVRDFQNLIGRAGRAGMHTEGSILFADTNVYDTKDNRRWNIVKELLNPKKSEECTSSLFNLIPLEFKNDRTKSNDRKKYKLPVEVLSFANEHINGWDSLNEVVNQIVSTHSDIGFTEEVVKRQVKLFSHALSSIESFLISNLDEDESSLSKASIDLAEQTLAYHLADKEKRSIIRKLFNFLANNISITLTEIPRRKTFGKTLYGLNDAIEIETWVRDHIDVLLEAQNIEDIVDITWVLIARYIHNRTFERFDNKDVLKDIAKKWISGDSFHELFQIAESNNCKLKHGSRYHKIKLENIIDICEGGLAYDGGLLVSAVCEFVEYLSHEGTGELLNQLQLFQKRLKYGLPTKTSITLYELGFSDRVISQNLSTFLGLTAAQKQEIIIELRLKQDHAKEVINKYPEYFQEQMKLILQ